jgi:hypothetical protein
MPEVGTKAQKSKSSTEADIHQAKAKSYRGKRGIQIDMGGKTTHLYKLSGEPRTGSQSVVFRPHHTKRPSSYIEAGAD